MKHKNPVGTDPAKWIFFWGDGIDFGLKLRYSIRQTMGKELGGVGPRETVVKRHIEQSEE